MYSVKFSQSSFNILRNLTKSVAPQRISFKMYHQKNRTLQSLIAAHFALIVFGEKPPCRFMLIRYCMFNVFLLFPHFFGFFPQTFPKSSPLFSLFSCQFDPFSPFLYCLVNYGYTSKNYTVCLFHPVHLLKFGVFQPCAFIPSCAFIKNWAIFHPVRLFQPVRQLESVE